MSQQLLDGVEMPAQFLLARHQLVDGSMTVAAQIDSLLHLLARVPLLEPLAAMARPRNQMMLRRPFARSTLAKFAALRWKARYLSTCAKEDRTEEADDEQRKDKHSELQ